MNDIDEPQITPHPEKKDLDHQLAQIAVRVHLISEDLERDRDEQSAARVEQIKFRTWLADQVKSMRADIASLVHDARQRNARLTSIEEIVSRMPCQAGGGNGESCPAVDPREGGMEP